MLHPTSIQTCYYILFYFKFFQGHKLQSLVESKPSCCCSGSWLSSCILMFQKSADLIARGHPSCPFVQRRSRAIFILLFVVLFFFFILFFALLASQAESQGWWGCAVWTSKSHMSEESLGQVFQNAHVTLEWHIKCWNIFQGFWSVTKKEKEKKCRKRNKLF